MKKCKKKIAKYIPSLSPLLYIISVEVLAVNLLALPNIVGLRLPNAPSCLPVLSLYADYTSVITSSDDAIRAFFFCVYDKFERGTGAKLNMEKNEGLWLGGWVHRSDCPVTIQWTSEKIKVLGVFLGTGIWTNAVGGLVWMLSRATSIPGVLVTYHAFIGSGCGLVPACRPGCCRLCFYQKLCSASFFNSMYPPLCI